MVADPNRSVLLLKKKLNRHKTSIASIKSAITYINRYFLKNYDVIAIERKDYKISNVNSQIPFFEFIDTEQVVYLETVSCTFKHINTINKWIMKNSSNIDKTYRMFKPNDFHLKYWYWLFRPIHSLINRYSFIRIGIR